MVLFRRAATWTALLAIATTGCNAIFGLDPPAGTDVGPDAPWPDAQVGEVRGAWREQRVVNGEDGAPIRVDGPVEDGQLAVAMGDGPLVPVPLGADGTFRFQRSADGVPYRLERRAGSSAIELQSDSAELELVTRVAGRAHPTPFTGPTMLHLALYPTPAPTPLATDVVSTGVWAVSPRISASTTGGQVVDWSQSQALSGESGLLSTLAHDRLYTLNFATRMDPSSNSYNAIARAAEEATPIEMPPDGQVDLLTAPAPLEASYCATIVTPRETAATRAAPTFGAPLDSGTMGILAVPDASFGPVGAYAIVRQFSASQKDQMTQVGFGTPFVGHGYLASASVGLSRAITAPGATSPTKAVLSLRSYQTLAPLAELTCMTRVELLLSAAIPSTFILDGTQLQDGMDVTILQKPATTLVWTLGAGTPPDVSIIALFQVSARADGTTALTELRRYETTAPRLEIESTLLVAGRHYVLSVRSTSSVPGASSGDFAGTRDHIEEAVMYTPMFTIAQ